MEKIKKFDDSVFKKLEPYIMQCMEEIYENCIDIHGKKVEFKDVYQRKRTPFEFFIDGYKMEHIINTHCESTYIDANLKNLFRIMCSYNNFSPCFVKSQWEKYNKDEVNKT